MFLWLLRLTNVDASSRQTGIRLGEAGVINDPGVVKPTHENWVRTRSNGDPGHSRRKSEGLRCG